MENQAKDQNEKASFSFRWNENTAVKDLLDVMVSILSEEYIQKAKEHPEIFSK